VTTPVIQVSGLSKRYRIGRLQEYDTLREALVRAARRPIRLPGRSSPAPSIWALRNIDLEVGEGEVVGIVGRNGAGKSTLLKILAGVTEPTSGHADLYGRIGCLLEVGTGFHKELTGRENVYLNGAMLGMTRREIRRKFDEIVTFAEVEKFLDTPVKRYSSGMYMRLAFAVAAHLEPEILIVDEVLAVGDAAFQKKCLGKMEDAASSGRTILFVSHNMASVQALCHRALWLDQGGVVEAGPTTEVVRKYLEATATLDSVPVSQRLDRQGDGSARITSLQIEDAEGGGSIRTDSRLRVTLGYEAERPLRHLQVYVSIYDLAHRGIFALNSNHVGGIPEELPRVGTMTCLTDPINLTPGRCYANVGLVKGGVIADRVEYAAYFDVEPGESKASANLPSRSWVLCLLDHTWSANGDEP
jgi:lipopolysaccharide transport system ATP-binding protein